jgi:molybdate transport system substrate-binding protein
MSPHTFPLARRRLLRRLGWATALVAAAMAPVQAARAGEVLVAVAANFAEVLGQLKPLFERQSGHTLVSTTGSTGKLYAQIKAGAPFQVLLSADAKTPERLEAEGAAVPGSRSTYAVGKLALWSAQPGRVAGDGVATLRAGAFRHIAIANPALAPYGVAAREVMQASGTWAALQGKLVMGENIGQAHSMVATGAAELGFVALSAVKSPRAPAGGSLWEVPARLHSPLQQDAVLLLPGRGSAAARAFLDFLRTPAARTLIEAHGYGVE